MAVDMVVDKTIEEENDTDAVVTASPDAPAESVATADDNGGTAPDGEQKNADVDDLHVAWEVCLVLARQSLGD